MRRNWPPNIGIKLAAVWLIVTGLAGLINLSFAGLPVIMSVLAIVAGVLIIAGR